MSNKKRLLSGIQPTGKPHVGNYFGMMKQMIDMQDAYEVFPFIVDYHALTTVKDGQTLRENTLNVAMDFLALGLDPDKVTFFKQSDVPEHTELTWILNCLTPFSMLQLAHAFKDAQANGKKEITVGLFDYPVLMISDIILYDIDIVPVGRDQQQHVEYARELASKFNNLYGDTFKEPQEKIMDNVAVVPGLDGQKMSKSYGNTIPLFATDEETEKAVMSAPMDSKSIEETKNPDDYGIYHVAKLFCDGDQDTELRAMFEQGGMGYGEIKKHVAGLINDYLRPMRERRTELEQNPDYVRKILKEGGEKARVIAQTKMKEVREKVGLAIYN